MSYLATTRLILSIILISETETAAVLPQVATAVPTGAYHQHHDVTAPQVDNRAFRQGWRVATRLEGLLEAGRIDREAWDCAFEWRRWAETVTPFKAQLWDVPRRPLRRANRRRHVGQVHAAAKLREAAQALGELRIRLLEVCVLHDRSWTELGRLMRVSDKTARDHAVEAINALADWRCGRPVSPPPVIRYRIEPGRQ